MLNLSAIWHHWGSSKQIGELFIATDPSHSRTKHILFLINIKRSLIIPIGHYTHIITFTEHKKSVTATNLESLNYLKNLPLHAQPGLEIQIENVYQVPQINPRF